MKTENKEKKGNEDYSKIDKSCQIRIEETD